MSLEICGLSSDKCFQKEQRERERVDCEMATSLVLSGLEV